VASDSQAASLLFPKGLISPIPVITTRREGVDAMISVRLKRSILAAASFVLERRPDCNVNWQRMQNL
jgi:hypothetical protein